MLAEADVLRGGEVTSYHSIRTDMVNAGAKWEDSMSVRDGNLITSRKPDDLDAFVREIIRAVEEEGTREAAE